MKKQSYNDLQQQLNDIVLWFESDDFNLDEAVSKYESAQKIIKEIEAYLTTTENKIIKLKPSDN